MDYELLTDFAGFDGHRPTFPDIKRSIAEIGGALDQFRKTCFGLTEALKTIGEEYTKKARACKLPDPLPLPRVVGYYDPKLKVTYYKTII